MLRSFCFIILLKLFLPFKNCFKQCVYFQFGHSTCCDFRFQYLSFFLKVFPTLYSYFFQISHNQIHAILRIMTHEYIKHVGQFVFIHPTHLNRHLFLSLYSVFNFFNCSQTSTNMQLSYVSHFIVGS